MAELVEDEGPVEITIPEARLDDAGRSYSCPLTTEPE